MINEQVIKEEIGQFLSIIDQAWNQCDIDTFMKAYVREEKTLLLSEGKAVEGWKAIYSLYGGIFKQRGGEGKMSSQVVRCDIASATSAVVTSRWQMEVGKHKMRGYCTLHLVKSGANWAITTDHSSCAQS